MGESYIRCNKTNTCSKSALKYEFFQMLCVTDKKQAFNYKNHTQDDSCYEQEKRLVGMAPAEETCCYTHNLKFYIVKVVQFFRYGCSLKNLFKENFQLVQIAVPARFY